MVRVQTDQPAVLKASKFKTAHKITGHYSSNAPWENGSCLGGRGAEVERQIFNFTDYLHKRDRVLNQNYLGFPERDR